MRLCQKELEELMVWRIKVLGCDTVLPAGKFQASERIIVALKFQRLLA